MMKLWRHRPHQNLLPPRLALCAATTADWVDIYNRLYRERIIFLGQEIDDEIANQVRARVCDARMKRESLNTRRARADHRGDAVSRLRER